MSEIQLIALDLDGTLLDRNDRLSARNRQAVEAALHAGVRVVLVTGRGTDVPARLVRELKLNLPAICAHGALTKDFLSGRTLGHIPVPLVEAVAMIEYAECNDLDLAIYSGERFHRLHGARLYMEDMKGPHWREVRSLIEVLHEAPTFLRFFGRRCVEAVQRTFSDRPLLLRHEVFGKLEECAVTSIEATKHRALERLCADLRVARERVIAIGDSPNDLPMLRWAGLGVAMGNAPLVVRKDVRFVTAPCEEDGVAEAIERYVLNASVRRGPKSA
ncbi:MAG: HAD hydrolase family protein [Candidatus Eremiobacteraeota bacterium]|nr:HAD hydrolase family protein [Candidatus Eremiobacteraeota bacterium]